ncbi:Large repetitive protein [Salmonella enterica subsp. arizonae]|uniref:Large repetitive protein n=1 Tax=Salmonella enterica subsp. arizonae TaxID=59203 RepID=A0A379RYQ4_SALER|nr:Large repetitive protein [Salmonella enterica subsp. arizonae]
MKQEAPFGPWVLAGAVAAGGIAAIASSGGGDSHHSDSDNPLPDNTNPDGNPPDNTNPDGNPPDNDNPGGTNPDGNNPDSSNPVDTTPPLAPSELLISADGKTVSGQAEAGSTITIKDPSGNVVGEGKTDSNGKFSIDLTIPQLSGEQLTVTGLTMPAIQAHPQRSMRPTFLSPIHRLSPPLSTMPIHSPAHLAIISLRTTAPPPLEGTGSAGAVIHIYAQWSGDRYNNG